MIVADLPLMKRIPIRAHQLVLLVMLTSGCQAAIPSVSPVEEIYAPVIDPANYVAIIDNLYMPMIPGTTFIYDGNTEKGSEHNEVSITAETKVILGVTCIIVKDTGMVDGALEEQTYDWYAQDKQGNVWYFGEDSKEYDNGAVVSTAGSWQAGVDGASPGIVMQADPTVGETYRQEYYKGEAEDWAIVLSLSESVSIPFGSYNDVLMTNEWSALDTPPAFERKYYAKGVGFIMTRYMQGGFGMILTEIRHK